MITAIVAIAAALIAAGLTWVLTRSVYTSKLEAQNLIHQKEVESMKTLAKQAQDNYEQALKQMKETVVASVTAETEKLLKAREKELTEGNQDKMDGIIKPLKESIVAMEKAMKENADSHLKSTTELSQQLKNAVKEMQEKTSMSYVMRLVQEDKVLA